MPVAPSRARSSASPRTLAPSASRRPRRAPARAKRRAVARPIPPAAPVITTARSRTAPTLQVGVEALPRAHPRGVAEPLLEGVVLQHRAVAEELDLLGAVLREARA